MKWTTSLQLNPRFPIYIPANCELIGWRLSFVDCLPFEVSIQLDKDVTTFRKGLKIAGGTLVNIIAPEEKGSVSVSITIEVEGYDELRNQVHS